MLTKGQVDFYHEHGYLHIPQVFNAAEIEELSDEMDNLVHDWATNSRAGPAPGGRHTWTRRRKTRSWPPCTTCISTPRPGCAPSPTQKLPGR